MTFTNDLAYLDYNSWSSSGDGGSSKEDIWNITTVGLVGIGLYTALLISTLIMYIVKRCKYSLPLRQMSSIFYIGLPIFSFLRLGWFVLELNTMDSVSLASNMVNRVSLCVFLWVFNALLFYWIDTVHTTVNVAFAKEAFGGSLDFQFITPVGRIWFGIVTIAVTVLTLILAIVRAVLIGTADKSASDYGDLKETINIVYDVNNIIISLMFLAYGICFFIYGTVLNCRIRASTRSRVSDLIKAEFFSVVLMVCFAIRCVMFSYRIMTGEYLDETLYIVLSYFVPEIVPSVMCLWSLNTKMFNDADKSSNNKKTPGFDDEEEDYF